MVNIRKFDEEEVLDAILFTFWQKGYESTSLDDLVKASGVKRQSLYNAFGNKDDMFLTVYKRYLERTKQAMEKVGSKSDMPIVDSVRKLLGVLSAEITNPDSPAGCFIANSMVEFAGRKHHNITQKIEEYYQDVEELLYCVFLNAQTQGTLSNDKSPRALAQFLLGSITSMAVMFRLNKNTDYIDNIINQTVLVFA